MSFDRLITTEMSANIVADLLDRGWRVSKIARAIAAPVRFVQGVRGRLHLLTTADVEILAKRSRQSAPLICVDTPASPRAQ